MTDTIAERSIDSARNGTFVADPSNLRALKRYAMNSGRVRSMRNDIYNDLAHFGAREWPVEESYGKAQLERIWGLLLLSDGKTFRDNKEARKLGSRERYVVANGTHFTFVGMYVETDESDRTRPGCERAREAYPVFRLYGGGYYMEFLFRPWQAHYLSKEHTGFCILGSGKDETRR